MSAGDQVATADKLAAVQFANARLTAGERFLYILVNTLTLGYPMLRKTIMKKALLEAEYARHLTADTRPPSRTHTVRP